MPTWDTRELKRPSPDLIAALEDVEVFRSALAELLALRLEYEDLNGGGPGWAGRNRAAWDYAAELFAP